MGLRGSWASRPGGTVRWTLVGGQMALLHALEHGQVPAQISQDGDVIADVRTDPGALFVGALVVVGLLLRAELAAKRRRMVLKSNGASG